MKSKADPIPKHPMQRLCKDEHGTLRYSQNNAVEALYQKLLSMGVDPFTFLSTVPEVTKDDVAQFWQLIGHSWHATGNQQHVTEEMQQTALRIYETGEGELESRNRYLEKRHAKMVKKLAPLCSHVFDIDIDDLEPR